MDENAASGLAAFGAMGTLFVLILAILWILVPFAIFGIKPLLRELIANQKKANEILSMMATQAGAAGENVTKTPAEFPLPPPEPVIWNTFERSPKDGP
jgi:hypothetical protein